MSIKEARWQVPGVLITALFAFSSAVSADLIISEYVEGSSNNKAIELYNTSPSDRLDLSEYALVLYRNGAADNTVSLALSGTLEPEQTYVIVSTKASDAVKVNATLETNKAMDFNGDDPMQIQKNGVAIDTIGNEPGSGQVEFGKDKTFARKADQLSASPVWNPEQWTEHSTDYFDGLGYTPNGDLNVAPPSGGDDDGPRPDFGQCGDESLRISAIQGSGKTSPMVGELATVQGIVTRTFPDSNLYYVQQESSPEDLEGASLGIQVYDTVNAPVVGNEVYLRGKVNENYGMTQLIDVKGDFDGACSTGNLIEPTLVTMAKGDDLEPYEGMVVKLDAASGFYVSETFKLNRYGETMLSIGGNRQKPTNLFVPGSDEAFALQEENDANILVLDNGISDQNTGEINYFENLSDEHPVRVGSLIQSGMEGILYFSYGSFRLIPDGQVTLDGNTALRVGYPESRSADDRRIASFNVLNYFNGYVEEDDSINWNKSDLGGARGAKNADEFAVQRSKIISAIARMDADIIGILEVENDGWDEQSALYDLVSGLNASDEIAPGHVYSFVKTEEKYIGTDVIKVSLIYNETAFAREGDPVILKDYPFDDATAKHRPPMIQTFKDKASGDRVTVVINHLKSKGSDCNSMADPEDILGQGNCNRMRVAAAETLGKYLEEHFKGQNALILGDLNA